MLSSHFVCDNNVARMPSVKITHWLTNISDGYYMYKRLLINVSDLVNLHQKKGEESRRGQTAPYARTLDEVARTVIIINTFAKCVRIFFLVDGLSYLLLFNQQNTFALRSFDASIGCETSSVQWIYFIYICVMWLIHIYSMFPSYLTQNYYMGDCVSEYVECEYVWPYDGAEF